MLESLKPLLFWIFFLGFILGEIIVAIKMWKDITHDKEFPIWMPFIASLLAFGVFYLIPIKPQEIDLRIHDLIGLIDIVRNRTFV
jgi:hypothetical protein